MRSFMLAAGIVTLAASVFGCGSGAPAKAPVAGKVTWKGQAVAKGNISFQGDKGPALMAEIVDGKYRLDGDKAVPLGNAKVMIDVLEEEATEVVIGPGKKAKAVRQIAPAKYNTASTLKADIKAGKDNLYDFDLTP